MGKTKQTACSCSSRRNIVLVSAMVLTSLFVLDVLFKGAVYRCLPVSWQNTLSEWIGR